MKANKRMAGLVLGVAGFVVARRVMKKARLAVGDSGKRVPRVPAIDRAVARIFPTVNRFVEWHKLPLPLAILNLLAFRVILREKNLHDTSPARPQGTVRPDPEVLYMRTIDGSYNDLTDVQMGATGVRFGRNMPTEYTYPDPEPQIYSPSPRTISRKLLNRTDFIPATSLNMLAAAWIQFMTHDWFNHGKADEDKTLEIPLESDDPWYDRPNMRIPRTQADPTRTQMEEGRPPAYRNAVSHWWDGSAIYGNDPETMAYVRSRLDGKLHVRNGRLPIDPHTHLAITGFNDNWWVGLGLMHTIFTLEHNAICDRLKADYPTWEDERLFQTARLINAALMAKIHTVEWTPAILGNPVLQVAMNANWWGLAGERTKKLFGRLSDDEVISGIPGSPTDQNGVPFTLTEEFVAVYRLHPLLPDELEIYSIKTGDLLKKLTMPEVIGRNAVNVFNRDVSIGDVLYSFGTTHPGAVTLHNYPRFLQDIVTQQGIRMDIAAVDIMRDRERGVPRYNQFRRLLHMKPASSFEQLCANPEWARELREVYDNDIERVDLMVGMFAETPPPGFGFSDTAFRIFILMASRRLKSDRFFTTDYHPNVYTKAGMDWIDDNTMVTVLLRHYPELAASLRGMTNAFKPWPRH